MKAATRMRPVWLFVLAGLLSAAGGGTASAQHREDWRDRDVHRFHEHDFDFWRRGRWIHGHHDGRFGWWWTVGPNWYFYPAPVYPYPDPFVPPSVPPQLYYYCDNPPGYYPYVPSCAVPWRAVPAG